MARHGFDVRKAAVQEYTCHQSWICTRLGRIVIAEGGALILGRGIVPAALVLLVLTAIITPLNHNFWAAPAQERANEVQHFANNIAIMAGLLAIAAAASARPL